MMMDDDDGDDDCPNGQRASAKVAAWNQQNEQRLKGFAGRGNGPGSATPAFVSACTTAGWSP